MISTSGTFSLVISIWRPLRSEILVTRRPCTASSLRAALAEGASISPLTTPPSRRLGLVAELAVLDLGGLVRIRLLAGLHRCRPCTGSDVSRLSPVAGPRGEAARRHDAALIEIGLQRLLGSPSASPATDRSSSCPRAQLALAGGQLLSAPLRRRPPPGRRRCGRRHRRW